MGPSPGTTWPHIPMFASCPTQVRPGPHINIDIEESQLLETNVKLKYPTMFSFLMNSTLKSSRNTNLLNFVCNVYYGTPLSKEQKGIFNIFFHIYDFISPKYTLENNLERLFIIIF